MKSPITYAKGLDVQLSSHFHLKELECSCKDCRTTIVNPDLIVRLEAMRAILGSKLHIDSGYRCADYQNQLRLRGYETSKGPSTHEAGMAADVSNGVTPGNELEDAARKAGFESVGVGKYFIHVDLRPGVRRWVYKR